MKKAERFAAQKARDESPWRPFRRLMLVISLLSAAAIAAALAWLWANGAPVRWELVLAVSLGIAGTLLLAGALMGLVFVSSRSGHDESLDMRSGPE